MSSRLYTTKQAGEFLHISTGTLLVWVKTEKLQALRFGPKTVRFSEDELRAFMARASKVDRSTMGAGQQ